MECSICKKGRDSMLLAFSFVVFTAISAFGEGPYEFRKRLEVVHQPNVRDVAVVREADEFAFANGATISIAEGASDFLRRVQHDFEDYLDVSQGVSVRCVCGRKGSLAARVDSSLPARQYRVDVTSKGVSIVGFDERAVAQAFYHLEDLMNLRRAPFLKIGSETRTPRFSVRMSHSGYGNDIFPEPHLAKMAHEGMTAIIVFLADIDKTKAQAYQDIKALIRMADKYGLDTYLYSYIKACAHPDDGDEAFRQSYGRIAGYYPEAKGIILVGESCQFPSKDPHVRKLGDKNDTRPNPGWYPCWDYPQWVDAVKRAIREKSPNMELVFWTYNWGYVAESERLRLIGDLSKDTTLMATFEMFERHTKRNGLASPVADYSIAIAGPGKYFASEAKAAKMRGLRLYTQANSGGLTWDYGSVPYQPIPVQWNARWTAMVKAHDDWGLSGVMENHHFGWWPSFISELEKEAFTEGGIPFEKHLRMIAVRDYGEANADRVVAIWKRWSGLARDYVPTNVNQYGPFRIGPAYPYNFGGSYIYNHEFPGDRHASNGIGICRLNYLSTTCYSVTTNQIPEREERPRSTAELELLKPMIAAYDEGADFFAGINTPQAKRMANLARYIARTTETAYNVKRGALAFFNKDQAEVLRIAREEYANAKAALPLVESDSRHGWEPSMEYVGGPRQIRWKLQRMEKLYGKALTDTSAPVNLALGKPYRFGMAPNYRLCTDPGDSVQLTDGSDGETVSPNGAVWTKRECVGWKDQKGPVEITIDLGRIESIGGYSMDFGAGAAQVPFPGAIRVYASEDGEKWQFAGDLYAKSRAENGGPRMNGKYEWYSARSMTMPSRGRWVRFVIDAKDYFFTTEIGVYSRAK